MKQCPYRAKQMRDEVEKVKYTVYYMVQHEEKVAEKPVVKRIDTQLKKPPKFPEFVDTDSED